MKIRAIFPGSFDPVHLGHINVAIRAAKMFETVVIGVYCSPKKNVLFSCEQRVEMFRRAVSHVPNIEVVSYDELTIHFAERMNATVMVRGLRVFSDFDNEFRMALMNWELNPSIETVSLITNHAHTFLSSTTIKEIAALGGEISNMVTPYVADCLRAAFKKDC
ncbi:MAG: pantetheine-phosphate adenylyltransferase [Chloroflexi bacterium]|mgnify:CR=1 FL=1|jgi:pantetheine-phosphate adenylyltransferase|nr:pantetheine-phosphate adenylyltransferase [Chloroflexota bacterium]